MRLCLDGEHLGPYPLDRPSTARRGGGPERCPVGPAPSSRVSSYKVGVCWGRRDFAARRVVRGGVCWTA